MQSNMQQKSRKCSTVDRYNDILLRTHGIKGLQERRASTVATPLQTSSATWENTVNVCIPFSHQALQRSSSQTFPASVLFHTWCTVLKSQSMTELFHHTHSIHCTHQSTWYWVLQHCGSSYPLWVTAPSYILQYHRFLFSGIRFLAWRDILLSFKDLWSVQ